MKWEFDGDIYTFLWWPPIVTEVGDGETGAAWKQQSVWDCDVIVWKYEYIYNFTS